MKEVTIIGNLLDSTADIIAHQVNASGGFGSGVAKAIRDKYPRVAAQYFNAYEKGLMKLGMCQIVNTNPSTHENRLIANLCGQEKYGVEKKRYTNYEGIYVALEKLATYCINNDIKSVAFPWKMSSDRGGADWFVIAALIESAFKDTDVSIEYWKLEK
jgi:O-acetyl-ADP-ribose deacetylase (regulator of RNase III)